MSNNRKTRAHLNASSVYGEYWTHHTHATKGQAMIISLSTDAAARIVAVHAAASDRGSASPILAGVSLRSIATDNGHALVVVATDGKMLIEEQWTMDAGNLGDGEVNLGQSAVDMLKGWLKVVDKSLGKRPSATIEMHWDGKVATFKACGPPVGDCLLRATEGCFPRYDHALRPTDEPTKVDRLGFNLDYFARVSDCWKEKRNEVVAVEIKHYRGTVIRKMRLPIGCQSMLALVMPISLPT